MTRIARAGAPLEPAVSIENLSKRYKAATALDDVSITINRGELLAILGPSGSGKSTLLSLVAGASTADSGRIRFGQRDVTYLPPAQREIGMVFQRYSLFPNRTVAQNVAFPLEVRRLPKPEIRSKVETILRLVGLESFADRYPSQISGGQAQRVAVARALVFDPSVMLMDEPFGALDKGLRRSLQTQVRKLQQELHMPTLFVTHDQEEAMSLADRIVILRDGRAIAAGTPQDLYRNPNSLWVAQFLGDANWLDVTKIGEDDGHTVQVSTTNGLHFRARSICGTAPSRAAVVLRPEDCVVLQENESHRPHVKGRITSVEFLGASQRWGIEAAGLLEFLVIREGRGPAGEIGDLVKIGWNADAPLVVTRE